MATGEQSPSSAHSRSVDPAASGDLVQVPAASLHPLWPSEGQGTHEPPLWKERELGEILRHQLNCPIEGVETDDPTTLGELLNQSSPPLERLRAVKDWAKPLMSQRHGDIPAEIAGVFYYTAICCALARCRERITTLDNLTIGKGADWALLRPWLDATTKRVLQEGLESLADLTS